MNGIIPSVLGTCGNFVEQQIGSERFNVFTDCTDARTRCVRPPLASPNRTAVFVVVIALFVVVIFC